MITRRTLLKHPLALTAATFTLGPAFAQSPTTMKLVVPSAVSTGTDTVARFLARALEKAFNTAVVVENYPGGGGVIGTTLASKAPPDGNTVLVFNSNFYLAPWVNDNVHYDPLKDFAPVASFCSSVQVLVTAPDSPYSSLKDVISAARKEGSDLSYASAGNGSVSHLAGALLNTMTGAKLRHIPYKSTSQGLTDVSAGTVTLGFLGVTGALALIKAGRLKVIATSGPRRSIYLPEVPTMAESGAPGYDITVPVLVFVPAGTPAPTIQRLAKAMTDAAASQAFKDFIVTQGLEPEILSTAELAASNRQSAEKWKKLAELSRAKAT